MTERKKMAGLTLPPKGRATPPTEDTRHDPTETGEASRPAATTTNAAGRSTSANKPASKATAKSGPTVVPARIPSTLYDALATHVVHQEQELGGRPSYAQVVTWACEEEGEAIVQDALAAVLAAVPDRRAPRGTRPAASNTTAISFRFFPDELDLVNGLQDRLRTAVGPELASRATRTAILIAALSRAVRT